MGSNPARWGALWAVILAFYAVGLYAVAYPVDVQGGGPHAGRTLYPTPSTATLGG